MSAPAADLRPPRHRVSPRAVRYWTVRALAAGPSSPSPRSPGSCSPRAGPCTSIALVVTVVLAAAHVTVMPRWRYAVHRWETARTPSTRSRAGSTRSGGSRRSRGSRPSTPSAARSSSSSAWRTSPSRPPRRPARSRSTASTARSPTGSSTELDRRDAGRRGGRDVSAAAAPARRSAVAALSRADAPRPPRAGGRPRDARAVRAVGRRQRQRPGGRWAARRASRSRSALGLAALVHDALPRSRRSRSRSAAGCCAAAAWPSRATACARSTSARTRCTACSASRASRSAPGRSDRRRRRPAPRRPDAPSGGLRERCCTRRLLRRPARRGAAGRRDDAVPRPPPPAARRRASSSGWSRAGSRYGAVHALRRRHGRRRIAVRLAPGQRGARRPARLGPLGATRGALTAGRCPSSSRSLVVGRSSSWRWSRPSATCSRSGASASPAIRAARCTSARAR